MTKTQTLPEDVGHRILSDPQRKHLLSLLEQHGGGTIDDLARQIAARRRDEDPETVSDDSHRRVVVSLIHKHLPLLEEHNIIQYNRENSVVVLLDVFDELQAYSPDRRRSAEQSILQNIVPGK